MKKIFDLCLIVFVVCSCNEGVVTTVKVDNSSSCTRVDEIIEVSWEDILNKLDLKKHDRFVVTDSAGVEVPYQITYNGKIIFPVNIVAQGEAIYSIKKDIPAEPVAKAYGRQYPERMDDIAWENDLVVFRTYGPALQTTGEKAFGYDVWVKNTKELVTEARYGKELNPETIDKIRELSQTDLHAADSLCCETSVSYTGIDGVVSVATGIVLHEGESKVFSDAENGFMTYVDPTEDANNNNGKIFIGAVFPEQVKEIRSILFSLNEKKERGAEGHLLTIGNYTGGRNYT